MSDVAKKFSVAPFTGSSPYRDVSAEEASRRINQVYRGDLEAILARVGSKIYRNGRVEKITVAMLNPKTG